MEAFLSIAVGLGLAAACGFRIFVPLLLVSIAHRTGHLGLAEGFEWMSSDPALAGFAVATLLEILAYYVPWVDNLLDTLAAPSAVVAGIIATASQVGYMDPWISWSVAVVGGGGAAGAVQGLTTVTRLFSTSATGGFGNPIVSTLEAGASVFFTLMAILVPLVGVFLLLVTSAFGVKVFLSRRENENPGTALAA